MASFTKDANRRFITPRSAALTTAEKGTGGHVPSARQGAAIPAVKLDHGGGLKDDTTALLRDEHLAHVIQAARERGLLLLDH